MKKKKIGRLLLLIGVIVLLVSLLLLFNTNSPWALIMLGLSVLINTGGVAVLLVRPPDQPD